MIKGWVKESYPNAKVKIVKALNYYLEIGVLRHSS